MIADQGKAILNPARRGRGLLLIVLISTVVGALAGTTATAFTLRLSLWGVGWLPRIRPCLSSVPKRPTSLRSSAWPARRARSGHDQDRPWSRRPLRARAAPGSLMFARPAQRPYHRSMRRFSLISLAVGDQPARLLGCRPPEDACDPPGSTLPGSPQRRPEPRPHSAGPDPERDAGSSA